MAKAQGTLGQAAHEWHRDAAIVLREPPRVDREVARLRIARTLELIAGKHAHVALAPESGVAPPSTRESGVLLASKRERSGVPSSKRESGIIPSSKRRSE